MMTMTYNFIIPQVGTALSLFYPDCIFIRFIIFSYSKVKFILKCSCKPINIKTVNFQVYQIHNSFEIETPNLNANCVPSKKNNRIEKNVLLLAFTINKRQKKLDW